jgi:hypothetical protein
MNNNGGVGVNADYLKATRSRSSDQTLGWIVDGSALRFDLNYVMKLSK